MYTAYLEGLPALENVHGFQLEPEEKVVFNTNLMMVGDEKGRLFSDGRIEPPLAFTNRRLIIRTNVINNTIWDFDLDNIREIKLVEKNGRIFKSRYYSVAFHRPPTYMAPEDDSLKTAFVGKKKIVEHAVPEIRLYFGKEGNPAFDELVRNLNR